MKTTFVSQVDLRSLPADQRNLTCVFQNGEGFVSTSDCVLYIVHKFINSNINKVAIECCTRFIFYNQLEKTKEKQLYNTKHIYN